MKMLKHSRIVALLLVTISLNTIPASAVNKSNLTGEAIFRGVLLGESPVADLFPEYYPNPISESDINGSDPAAKARKDTEEELLSKFRAQFPSFFRSFGEDMQSGDRIKISRALEESHSDFESVANGFDDPHRLHALAHKHAVLKDGKGVERSRISLLIGWSMLSDLDKDQLTDRVAQRLGTASRN
jgi:SdpC family antimicrobial peptide